jgi:hypothetical protein
MQTFLPVDKCIYCGETKNLSDEHIVPLSLNGKWILPKASCLNCAKITSAFEGRVAKMLASFRQSANLKTRRPNKRRQTVSLRDDTGNIIEMPNTGMWDTLPTFQFPLPGIYRKKWTASKGWAGVKLGIKSNQPTIAKLAHWNKFNTKTFEYETPMFDIDSYALMLAKIGHCIAVGHYGIDNFDHFLPPFILGNESFVPPQPLNSQESETDLNTSKMVQENSFQINLSYFVGSFDEILPPSLLEHEYGFEIQETNIAEDQHLIYTRIRLFPFSGGPTACVVVGQVNQEQSQKCKDQQRRIALHCA